MKSCLIAFLTFFISTSVLADGSASTGNPVLGESAFKKQCVSCHVVVNKVGKKLAGRNGRTGPNLYGLAGTVAGMVEGYRYGKSIVTAGSENGLIWSEQTFVAYVQDPRGFLRNFLGDKKARAKMTYKVRKQKDALNIYAYLLSLSKNK